MLGTRQSKAMADQITTVSKLRLRQLVDTLGEQDIMRWTMLSEFS